MSGKTIAIVSYFTIIGWIIALIAYQNSTTKSLLARYHLKQSLGLFVSLFLLNLIVHFSIGFMPGIGFAATIVYVLYFILFVAGIIYAANEEMKPLPVVGVYFENWFSFLK